MKTTLNELKSKTKKEGPKFKTGDTVIFGPMSGVWFDLESLTGTIIGKAEGYVQVRIHFPHLLKDPAAFGAGKSPYQYEASTFPDALTHFDAASMSHANKGLVGLKINEGNQKMSGLVATREKWRGLIENSLSNLNFVKLSLEDEQVQSNVSSFAFFRDELAASEKNLGEIFAIINDLTAKIKLMVRKGVHELSIRTTQEELKRIEQRKTEKKIRKYERIVKDFDTYLRKDRKTSLDSEDKAVLMNTMSGYLDK